MQETGKTPQSSISLAHENGLVGEKSILKWKKNNKIEDFAAQNQVQLIEARVFKFYQTKNTPSKHGTRNSHKYNLAGKSKNTMKNQDTNTTYPANKVKPTIKHLNRPY